MPNHYLDAEVYAVAAADMLRVSAMRKEQTPTIHQPKRSGGFNKRNKSKWIKRGGGRWLRNE